LITTFTHEALRLLLRHEYRTVQEKYSHSVAARTAKRIFENDDTTSAVKAAVAVAVAKAVSAYADYTLGNNTAKLEASRREIQDACQLARHIADRSILAALEEISYLIERYPHTYSRRVLHDWESKLGKEYLSLLTTGRHAIHQLWPSQIEALQ